MHCSEAVGSEYWLSTYRTLSAERMLASQSVAQCQSMGDNDLQLIISCVIAAGLRWWCLFQLHALEMVTALLAKPKNSVDLMTFLTLSYYACKYSVLYLFGWRVFN